jgi:hypothetical protein
MLNWISHVVNAVAGAAALAWVVSSSCPTDWVAWLLGLLGLGIKTQQQQQPVWHQHAHLHHAVLCCVVCCRLSGPRSALTLAPPATSGTPSLCAGTLAGPSPLHGGWELSAGCVVQGLSLGAEDWRGAGQQLDP